MTTELYSSILFKYFKHFSPKPLCLVVEGPPEAPRLIVVELRDELCVLHLVRVGRKLHRDWLGGAGRFLAVQALHGFFSLGSLIKPDKSHAAGHTWEQQSKLLQHQKHTSA